MPSRSSSPCALLVALCLGTLLGGCSSRLELGALEAAHVDWDTLLVSQPILEVPAQVDSVVYYVFDSTYDTLYTGTDRRIPLPDAQLGHQERLLVEVCAWRLTRQVCAQTAARASPKRITATPEVDYPLDASFTRGRYQLQLERTRQVFGDPDTWEPLPGRTEAWLRVLVQGQPGTTLHLPVRRARDQFDLSEAEGFSEFRYQIESALLDGEEAPVAFVVHAQLGPTHVAVDTVLTPIRNKTDEERRADVTVFVEQAAAQVVERMGLLDDGDGLEGVTAYLDAWSYNRLNRQYTIEIEIAWSRRSRGVLRRRRAERVFGTLQVGERGRQVQFRLQRATGTARDRWARAVGDDVITLRTLRLPPGSAGEAPTAAAARAAPR
ncbi:MAG: hypothetical protein AAF970_12540 [Bacteroidota bacterium]